MEPPRHRSRDELEAALEHVRGAPPDEGRVELIVCRPEREERTVCEHVELSTTLGAVGDMWATRPSTSSPDGGPHPDRQVTLVNARAIAAIAGGKEHWALAGDQLYVDLDLSRASLPAGTQLAIGSAVIEITAEPHRGCAKFRERFGIEAVRFVNSPAGRDLNLRGVNARVLRDGTVRVGDTVRKVSVPAQL
jgi:MOSC domain-containing protein YiiM